MIEDETGAFLGHGDVPSDDSTMASVVSRRMATAIAARFMLYVTEGAEQGAEVIVDASRPSRLIVGQSQSADFRLSDDEVSRRHATFEVRGAYLQLIDLGSTNGTWVNGIRINDVLLAGGEIVRIGNTNLEVRVVDAQVTTPLSLDTRFGMVIGESEEMRRLYPLCERLADNDVPVVIEGETGTGKELLAEAIHDKSRRCRGAFVVFDCTSVPANMLSATLFGEGDTAGLFEEANGGTLFIDELADLDLVLQSKLIRAVERGEFRREGAREWHRADVRMLSATRRDLDQALQVGSFREDLHQLLTVARIELPPLRRRHGDIEVLARHFWRRIKTDGSDIPSSVLSKLEAHTWPGNVRELHHAVARYVALGELSEDEPTGRSSAPTLEADAFDAILARDLPLPRARAEVVEAFERRYVERVLARHGGNVTQAAAASGLGRRYFQILRAKQKGATE